MKTIASTDRRKAGPAQERPGSGSPFGALIAAAGRDADAARSLALAYVEHETEMRLKLLAAIVDDARSEGVDVGAVLAPLLSVEPDATVARAIAAAMQAHGGAGLAPSASAAALVAGDGHQGGVVLARPLYAGFVEILAAAWAPEIGVTHVVVEPFAHASDLEARAAELPPHLELRAAPIARAIDLLADVLWRHRRRHGRLPDGLERFADLFG